MGGAGTGGNGAGGGAMTICDSGIGTMDPTCNTCLGTNCCKQAEAVGTCLKGCMMGDTACQNNCLGAMGATMPSQASKDLGTCEMASCKMECGGGGGTGICDSGLTGGAAACDMCLGGDASCCMAFDKCTGGIDPMTKMPKNKTQLDDCIACLSGKMPTMFKCTDIVDQTTLNTCFMTTCKGKGGVCM